MYSSRTRGRLASVALLIAALALLTGCSSVMGPGKRIKDGFEASYAARTASFVAVFKMKLPQPTPGEFAMTLSGDVDPKGTKTEKDDDVRMTFALEADGKRMESSEMVVIADRQWMTVGGKTIGGPADLTEDATWDKLMGAIVESVEDLKESGTSTIAGTAVDTFSAALPQGDVCQKLLPVIAEFLEESKHVEKARKACVSGLTNPVALEIGIDSKDWPRLVSARAKLGIVSLMTILGVEEAGEGPPELNSLKADVTIDMRVTQYDKPIEPIVAPSGAKMYDTLAEFERASDGLVK